MCGPTGSARRMLVTALSTGWRVASGPRVELSCSRVRPGKVLIDPLAGPNREQPPCRGVRHGTARKDDAAHLSTGSVKVSVEEGCIAGAFGAHCHSPVWRGRRTSRVGGGGIQVHVRRETDWSGIQLRGPPKVADRPVPCIEHFLRLSRAAVGEPPIRAPVLPSACHPWRARAPRLAQSTPRATPIGPWLGS